MKVFALLFAAAAATGVSAQDENMFAAACDDKSVGDECSFTQPSGEETSGTCFSPASPSACGPGYDDGTAKCVMCGEADPTVVGGDDGAGGDAKVMPAVSACTNASLGDTCAYVGGDGAKATGVCADEGPGACGPGYEDSSTPCYVCNTDPVPGSGDTGGVSGSTNECSDLAVGDTCTVVRGDTTISGVCQDTEENEETGDGKLSCSPIPPQNDDDDSLGGGDSEGDDDGLPISTALQDACSSLSAGDDCSYTDPASNTKVTGICATDGSRDSTLQCDNEDVSSGGFDPTNDPLVLACSGSAEGASCSADFGVTTIQGACSISEDGDLFCAPQVPSARARRSLRN